MSLLNHVSNCRHVGLHFVLIPLMAQGHTIPMIDMAKLFAHRGITVTLIITPLTAARYEASIRRTTDDSGLPIHLKQIPFRCQDVGLPDGCESLDIVPSRDLLPKFFDAIAKMQDQVEKYLHLPGTSKPTCIISDKYLAWTSDTARKFRIPRVVFHGTSCFSLLISHNLHLHGTHREMRSDSEPFLIPGVPGFERIEVTRAQLPGEFAKPQVISEHRDPIRDAEAEAFGVVINSFGELENGCVEAYRKAVDKGVWCVGPVSLCNAEKVDKFERGDRPSIDQDRCLGWLNSRQPRSVVYACLGSLCRVVPAQLIELGKGLEASGRPFVWVVKKVPELEKWLTEDGFEDRVRDRGLVIRGWAPQVLILSHAAVGGFLTHCGWNSTSEAVGCGVPMATWPLFAEQFLNERLVVDVLKVGVPVGVKVPVRWGDEERVGVLVRRDGVERAVERLMDGGEEGEDRRKRAIDLGVAANKSMGEGGSSYLGVTRFIKDIIQKFDELGSMAFG